MEPSDDGAAREPDATELALRSYNLYAVMPLWIASGSIDYWLHRRSKIEANAGTHESLLHAFGISMSAVPVLAGLFLEVNAGVVLAMIAGYAAHAGMTIWDVAYASTKREVTPAEQHVHGMLELLPFTALSLVLVGNRAQALALVGRGAAPRFGFEWKRRPLPTRAVAGTIAAFVAFVGIPYAEELARCYRYERSRNAGEDVVT